MALWIAAAVFDLYAQWRLLSPPWISFFGDSTVSYLLTAYALCGMVIGFLLCRIIRHRSHRWSLVLIIPLYVSLCSIFLGRAAHTSAFGFLLMGLTIGSAALLGQILRNVHPHPVAGISILVVLLPLLVRTETSDGPTIKPAGMVRESPNVILVTIDTLRPDRLGRWGYERSVTPGLDSLASVGLVFTDVSAPMPATAPSIASLLTGCYPNAHGVRRNGWPFSNRVESLASMLQHAGYETGAAVSVAHLAGEYGWNRGFQWFDNQGVYDRLFPYSGTHILRAIMRILPIRYERRAEQSIRNAIHWLETTRGPFFLWLHLWDPHYPYMPPDADGSMFSGKPNLPAGSAFSHDTLQTWIDGYDGEVQYTDRSLDSLWQWLRASGRDSNTVVAVVSDHGESLGERSYRGHSILLFEEQIRILFLVSAPMIPDLTGEISMPGSIVDVVPTVLGLLGMQAKPYSLDGMDLMLELKGQHLRNRPVYFESDMWGFRCRGLRHGSWKLIVHDRINPGHPDFANPDAATRLETGTFLYDISTDPAELHDLSTEKPGILAALSDLLDSRPDTATASDDMWQSPAMRKQLEELGYVE